MHSIIVLLVDSSCEKVTSNGLNQRYHHCRRLAVLEPLVVHQRKHVMRCAAFPLQIVFLKKYKLVESELVLKLNCKHCI